MSKGVFFGDDWLELQQKYWDSWAEMSNRAMGKPAMDSATSSWGEAVDQWWKAFSPATSDTAQTFMDRLIDQGKIFFQMADSFRSVAGDSSTPATAFWTRSLEEMQKRYTGSLGEGDEALRHMMSFWELPLDNWQRMVSSLSPVPGDFLRNMPKTPWKENLDRVLTAPGLGYTREEQSQLQDLTRHTLEYQVALQEYIGFFNRVGTKSIERMGQSIQEQIARGSTIESARTLYDTWVICCENVYGEEVATPEYARIHGRLINAQMAVKRRMSIMVDEYLGAMNMPTRQELRTLQERQQEIRRENKHLRSALHRLEKQVQALAGDKPATALKKTTPRKTQARRKADTQEPAAD